MLDVVGEKWTLLVLREAFTVCGASRTSIAPSAVRAPYSAPLETLVEEGLLATEPCRDLGSRTRSEYRLTEKGLELSPALVCFAAVGRPMGGRHGGPRVEVATANAASA